LQEVRDINLTKIFYGTEVALDLSELASVRWKSCPNNLDTGGMRVSARLWELVKTSRLSTFALVLTEALASDL